MRRRLLLPALLSLALTAFSGAAQAGIVADLSSRRIEITSKFTGTELLLFGARQEAGNVIYVIRGPEQSFLVSKKERIAGIWVNTNPKRFHAVPGLYAVGSDNGFTLEEKEQLLQSLDIIRPGMIRADGSSPLLPDHAAEYHAPLLEALEKRGLYSREINAVSFYGDTLFKAALPFSKHIPRGDYTAEIYLLGDNTLQAALNVPLKAEKTGFDAFLYDAAYHHPLLYGILCVLFALFAGWCAGQLFRRT